MFLGVHQRYAIAACVWFFFCSGCGALSSRGDERKEREELATYHYNLAYGHYFDATNKNVDASLQELLKSLAAKPDNPEAHFLAGLIYLGRGETGMAIRHFQTTIRLKPKDYAAYNNLGTAYLSEGRWDDAIDIYRGLIGEIHYATPAHSHNNLGWAWFKKRNFEKAMTHFKQAIRLNPSLCPAYNNLGQTQLEQGELVGAQQNLKRAAERCPNYAEPHYHLGRALVSKRQPEQAMASFQKCRKLAGDSPLGERCSVMVQTMKRGKGNLR